MAQRPAPEDHGENGSGRTGLFATPELVEIGVDVTAADLRILKVEAAIAGLPLDVYVGRLITELVRSEQPGRAPTVGGSHELVGPREVDARLMSGAPWVSEWLGLLPLLGTKLVRNMIRAGYSVADVRVSPDKVLMRTKGIGRMRVAQLRAVIS